MTVIEIDSKKTQLIEKIKAISDDNLLLDLERMLLSWKNNNEILLSLVKPTLTTQNI